MNRESGHQKACEWITVRCIIYNIIMPERFELSSEDIQYPEDIIDEPELNDVDNSNGNKSQLFNFILRQ